MRYQSIAICKIYFFVISSPFLSILVTFFSIGTVKVMYFSVFSPKQVNCLFLILLASDNNYKYPLWKTVGVFLGTLYFKLHILCAAQEI